MTREERDSSNYCPYMKFIVYNRLINYCSRPHVYINRTYTVMCMYSNGGGAERATVPPLLHQRYYSVSKNQAKRTFMMLRCIIPELPTYIVKLNWPVSVLDLCGRRIPKYLRMEMHKLVISNRKNPIIDFSE